MAAPLAGKRPITIATALGHSLTPRLGVCGYYADGGTTTNLSWGQISDADRKARFRRVANRPGSLFVMNVASGPGTAVKAVETVARDEFAHAGVTVLGYVSCRDSGTLRPAADVKGDIDRWITFYSPDGIFLDEGEPGQTNADLAYYQDLAAYVRAKNPALLVGYNPGTHPHSDYYQVMDIIMMVEHPVGTFLDPAQVADHDKTRKGPARSWAMVYGVTAGQVPAVLARARELGLHYLSVLDTDPNADWYQTLPPDSYLDAVARPAAAAASSGSTGTAAEVDTYYQTGA